MSEVGHSRQKMLFLRHVRFHRDSNRTADIAACRKSASPNERGNYFGISEIFASFRTQISFISFAIPAHTKGRFAIVTNVGLGCDGRECATDERANLRTAKSCGPDASMVGVKLAEEIPPMTVTTKPDHRGEYEISCKTIACGNAGCPGATVVTNARAYYSTRAAAGATGTRHSPLPPWGSAHALCWADYVKLGRNALRERGRTLRRHHPRKRMIRYSETSMMEARSRG
jgi:hypothetical protein